MRRNQTEPLGLSQRDRNYYRTTLTDFLVLVVYVGAVLFIMSYHEPWFDEAQAWLIARDASIGEILSTITHYEGHPPFWFLILMPFAKLGVPFEIGVKAINLTIMTAAIGLFLFKAPFSRLIRYTIPFTYFFFYQYGVISRPYSLMILGFMLSAWLYKDRNEKPFRFAGALAILCGASAYGIILSAGICLVWLWELLNKTLTIQNIRTFLNSKSFLAMLLLFIFNLLLVKWISPFPDTFGTSVMQASSHGQRYLYMFFMAPADATCTLSYFATTINIQLNAQSIGCFIMSCFINIFLFLVTRMHNKHVLFIVPYFFLGLFGGTVYYSTHHIGIIMMFYLFLFWCCWADKPEQIQWPKGMQRLLRGARDEHIVQLAGCALVSIVICTQLYWSVMASIHEMKLNYGTGKEAAAFITDNKLDQLKMMTAWLMWEDPETGEKYHDYNFLKGIPTLAYFNKNIFYNFNEGLNNRCYLLHRVDVEGVAMKKLAEKGAPDVLFGDVDLETIFGTQISMEDYVLVKNVRGNTIWKDHVYENYQFIYLRKDLLVHYPAMKILNPWYETLPQ